MLKVFVFWLLDHKEKLQVNTQMEKLKDKLKSESFQEQSEEDEEDKNQENFLKGPIIRR